MVAGISAIAFVYDAGWPVLPGKFGSPAFAVTVLKGSVRPQAPGESNEQKLDQWERDYIYSGLCCRYVCCLL